MKKALGVIGVGILGCSVALRYRACFPSHAVLGLDVSPAHLARARERGAITDIALDLRDLAQRAEIVVLAAPIAGIVDALHALSGFAGGEGGPSLILDVASIKQLVCEAGAALPQFIGTHPMAGSEAGGPDAARADLFERRPWAYVPGANAALIAAVRAFIADMGAYAVEITAAEHDRLVARTSHLPQTLSTVLATQALREPVHGLYGQGLLDMIRLARSSDAIWNDIYIANSHAIAEELERCVATLQTFIAAIKCGDREAVRMIFEHANRLAAETKSTRDT